VTPSGQPIRWAGGPLFFALESDDAAVMTLAAAVFRPWASADERVPSHAWRIDPVDGNGSGPAWRVRSSVGRDTELPSPARAVSAVEYNAVAAIAESEAVIVHGALVVRDGRGLLLAGRGEAGKSTLACALWDRGATLLGDSTLTIDTLRPRDARTLEFKFVSQRTGQAVASYLNLDTSTGSSGTLKFSLAVGERGVALSPDTLVLPTSVDLLPPSVVEAAMRVLG